MTVDVERYCFEVNNSTVSLMFMVVLFLSTRKSWTNMVALSLSHTGTTVSFSVLVALLLYCMYVKFASSSF